MTLFFMTPQYLKRLTGQRGTLITGLLLVMLLVPSCIPQKKILYLQRQADEAREIYPFTDPPDYRIKTGDILYIQVLTPDELSRDMFNTETTSRTMTSRSGSQGIGDLHMYLHGYNVDEKGKITMPVIGEVKLAGKTIEEATKHIEEKVEEYLIGATVMVKLVNNSITVLGEIRSPGKY